MSHFSSDLVPVQRPEEQRIVISKNAKYYFVLLSVSLLSRTKESNFFKDERILFKLNEIHSFGKQTLHSYSELSLSCPDGNHDAAPRLYNKSFGSTVELFDLKKLHQGSQTLLPEEDPPSASLPKLTKGWISP